MNINIPFNNNNRDLVFLKDFRRENIKLLINNSELQIS